MKFFAEIKVLLWKWFCCGNQDMKKKKPKKGAVKIA